MMTSADYHIYNRGIIHIFCSDQTDCRDRDTSRTVFICNDVTVTENKAKLLFYFSVIKGWCVSSDTKQIYYTPGIIILF